LGVVAVILATGLGKTWLAAFDAVRMGARRILFPFIRDRDMQSDVSNPHIPEGLKLSESLLHKRRKCLNQYERSTGRFRREGAFDLR